MLKYLPLCFLIGFFVEIASIIWMGGAVGIISTLLLLIAGGVLGINLFRSAGVNLSAALRSSRFDTSWHQNLASKTLFRVVSGILFLVPGFFSDLVALVLFVPAIQKWLVSRFGISVSNAGPGGAGHNNRPGEIIELEAVEIEAEFDGPDQDRIDPTSRHRR